MICPSCIPTAWRCQDDISTLPKGDIITLPDTIGHDLAAILSQVETRQAANNYTIQVDNQIYQIERASICAGLRGGTVRIERRLDGSLAVRFRERRLVVCACAQRPMLVPPTAVHPKPRSGKPPKPSPALRAAMNHLFDRPGPPVWAAARDDRTRTRDRLD